MFYSKKANIIIVAVLLGVVAAFAWIYNAYVSQAVTDAANRAKTELQTYNNEIIEKLVNEDSAESWNTVLEQYNGIIITVEDSENNEVAATQNNNWSALDVYVRTPFEYNGEAFLITSSVYLLEDYVTDLRAVTNFLLVELFIVMSVLALLIFAIYMLMLRPFRILYKIIEDYDETGKLRKANVRGYAGQVYRRFVSMTKNLEANQENQRRIIASISHDIKTPLTSIMGYAERLQKDTVSPERKKHYLQTVYGKSIEIQELVSEFDEYLSFNHKQQVTKMSYGTEKIAKYIVQEYNTDLEDMGVKLIVNNYSGNAFVELDKQRIKRVFGNVIANSVKHFEYEEKIIRVDIRSDKEKVYFEIHDNGEGVPEEKLELIFEPLYTSDEGRKVAGLGLSICHEIIEAHSGKIYAKSSDLGGVAICFELDRADKKHKKQEGIYDT